MVHEEDSPFSMDQIRTSILDTEPAREQANLLRVKLDPEMEIEQPGLNKSDPIATNVTAQCADVAPPSQELKSQSKKERVGRSMEILGTKEVCLAKVGTFPGHSARILWRENGSIFKQEGIPYFQEADEIQLPLDARTPEVMERDPVSKHRR